jgi:hypothetical protein
MACSFSKQTSDCSGIPRPTVYIQPPYQKHRVVEEHPHFSDRVTQTCSLLTNSISYPSNV